MRVDDVDFELPPELVAQRPAAERDRARLMALPRAPGPTRHLRVSSLPEILPPGALLVVNDTRVIGARLVGRKTSGGGRVELLLVRREGSAEIQLSDGRARRAPIWRARGRASKPFRQGTDIELLRKDAPEPNDPALFARLVGHAPDGLLEVALWTADDASVERALSACGRVPLPPYIKRQPQPDDAERYQTVYARHDGAIAAPTAGLHLTQALLERIESHGCEIAAVTLHVGLATFEPVRADDFDAHVMHAERYHVPDSTVDAVRRARVRRAPVVAVGTTTARALESAADPHAPGLIIGGDGETRLLIQPGYRWQIVDGLFTNFHLARSTLLAMVCSFAGTTQVMDAYRLAVDEGYRFFSYGDAMLLWRAS
jgi:S-adenosylmethionine:tRNA ribosyltransferase-isomerase